MVGCGHFLQPWICDASQQTRGEVAGGGGGALILEEGREPTSGDIGDFLREPSRILTPLSMLCRGAWPEVSKTLCDKTDSIRQQWMKRHPVGVTCSA